MKLEAILNRWKKRSTFQRSGNLGGSRQRKQDDGLVPPPTNNGGAEVARAMQEESQNLSEHSSIDSDDAIIDAPGLVAAALNRQTPKQIMMSNIRRHTMIRRRRPLALIREINLGVDTEDAIIEDAIPSPDIDARSSSQENVVVSPNEKSEYDDRSTLQLIRQVIFLRVNTAATTATNPASSPSISSQCDSPSLRALWNSMNNLQTPSRSSSSSHHVKPQNLAGPTTNAETSAGGTSSNENSGASHNRADGMDEEERASTSANYFFPRLRRRRRRPLTPHKEHPFVVDPSSSGESTISPAHHNRSDNFLVTDSLE